MDQPATSGLARKAWVEACHFHTLTQAEVLAEVARRVSAEKNPLVVLDLDSTLYEVGPRTFQIISEWKDDPSSAPYPGVRIALGRLLPGQVGYSIKDTLRTLGLDLTSQEVLLAWATLKSFWMERFFTSHYLKYDKPYPGAAEFARKLHTMGAELVYLTGRDEPAMGVGTRANLLRDGFPWGIEKTRALLKTGVDVSDLEHKTVAADFLNREGKVVASFENEPLNLVALYERFPHGMHVFVDTVSSDRLAPVVTGLYRISGFESS